MLENSPTDANVVSYQLEMLEGLPAPATIKSNLRDVSSSISASADVWPDFFLSLLCIVHGVANLDLNLCRTEEDTGGNGITVEEAKLRAPDALQK